MSADRKEPIRILQVVGRMDRGGTEALLMSAFRHVNKAEVIFDFVEQTEDHCDYDDEILSLGGKIWRCPTISLRNINQYRKWWINFLNEHPEYYVIHGHSRGSGPIYLSVAKAMGRITIIHCHSNSMGKGLSGIKRAVWQYPLHFIPDYYFACSQDAGYSQFGRHRKFTVIKNGIETEKYVWNPSARKKIRDELNLKDAYVIGNVARFSKPKNHEFLIDIFLEVKKRIPNAKLLLAGGHSEGDREEMIRNKFKALNLQDDVMFLGVRDDVNQLLQAMDLFLLPSHFEGMPLSLVEAQAASLPCVVSKDHIPQEINVTGLVTYIPLSESAAEWADIILSISEQNMERKDQSAAIAREGFDISSSCDYLCGFYKYLFNQVKPNE